MVAAAKFNQTGILLPSRDISMRRCTEQAAILAAELRRTFIADPMSCRCSIHPLSKHEPAGFVQAQLLLILHGDHRCHSAEVVVESPGCHRNLLGQLLDSLRLYVIVL